MHSWKVVLLAQDWGKGLVSCGCMYLSILLQTAHQSVWSEPFLFFPMEVCCSQTEKEAPDLASHCTQMRRKVCFKIHCYSMHLLKTILIRSWLLQYKVDGHSWVNSCPWKVDARQLFSTAPEENLNHITCFFIVGVWRCAILLCMAIMNMIWIQFDCNTPLGLHRRHFIYIA